MAKLVKLPNQWPPEFTYLFSSACATIPRFLYIFFNLGVLRIRLKSFACKASTLLGTLAQSVCLPCGNSVNSAILIWLTAFPQAYKSKSSEFFQMFVFKDFKMGMIQFLTFWWLTHLGYCKGRLSDSPCPMNRIQL